MTDDILVVPLRSKKQTNAKKYVASDGTIYFGESKFAAQITENDLLPRKENTLWKYNDYLCKIHILNVLTDDLYDYCSSCNTIKQVCETLKKEVWC